MRNVIKAAVVALVLALAAPVIAQDYEAGVAAYNRGDYAAALGEFRALAEQGHATAQTNLGIMYHDGLAVATWVRIPGTPGSVVVPSVDSSSGENGTSPRPPPPPPPQALMITASSEAKTK